MRKPIFLLTVVIFFIILPAVFICRGVSFSEEVLEIETKAENLRLENKLLEKELVQRSSSALIYSEAGSSNYKEVLVNKQETDKVALKR